MKVRYNRKCKYCGKSRRVCLRTDIHAKEEKFGVSEKEEASRGTRSLNLSESPTDAQANDTSENTSERKIDKIMIKHVDDLPYEFKKANNLLAHKGFVEIKYLKRIGEK